MSLFGAIWGKICEISNKQFTDKATQIEGELHDAGYKYYPNSTRVVPSFKVMDKGGDAQVSGLITNIRVGSTLREAYWAVYGNGGSGTLIYPNHVSISKYGMPRTPMLGKYPSGIPGYGWKPYVHGYDGHDFVSEVANRHR